MRNVSLRSRLLATGTALLAVGTGFVATRVTTSHLDKAIAQEVAAGPSYLLTDIRVTYPYEHSVRSEGGEESRLAGVSFLPVWNGTTYPGTAVCSITLYSPAGNTVGTLNFLESTDEPDHPEQRSSIVPVPVEGEAAFGTGQCQPGNYDEANGYQFAGPVSVEGQEDLLGNSLPRATELTFGVSWIGDEPPGTRTCSLQVFLSGGLEEVFGPYNVSTADPQAELDFTVPIKVDRVLDAAVECKSYGQ